MLPWPPLSVSLPHSEPQPVFLLGNSLRISVWVSGTAVWSGQTGLAPAVVAPEVHSRKLIVGM